MCILRGFERWYMGMLIGFSIKRVKIIEHEDRIWDVDSGD